MPIDFNTALGVHEQALYLRARRSEVLASNLANADTPDFKARDFDFREALARATSAGPQSGVTLTRTSAAHLPAAPGGVHEQALQYRNPYQPALDGNTVEAQQEQANFIDNAVRYQATLRFLGGRFSGMKTAITGGR